MSLQEVMSGGNGVEPPANPTSPTTVPANSQPGSDPSQGSGSGNEVKLAAWTQQLSKDLRENPEYAAKLANLEKLDDLAKGYLDAQGKTDIPGKDAKPEEINAFWKRLGYPEDPKQYAVAKEQGADTFIASAHAARLTDEQATALWKSVSEGQARQAAAVQQAQMQELAATDAALQKEYGDKYDQAIKYFERGAGNIRPLLMSAGVAGNPAIIKAFIALGEAMQESGSPKSDSPSGEMKSIFEGGGFKYK